jgi:DNA-binding transcriptional regulator YiaG
MSNVMTELKSEITRLARKEIKGELAQVKKVNATQRGLIAGLRKQVDAIQRELNGLKKAVPSPSKAIKAKEPSGRFWISGKGVKALRKRLGLTQAGLAKLAGVSGAAVVNWEKNDGKINLRKGTAGKLQEIRGLGKRDVAGVLGIPAKAKKAGKAVKAKAKPKKASKGRGRREKTAKAKKG